MTATLFDCDHCEQARDELAAARAEIAWLRKHVEIPPCSRCRMGGGMCGYRDEFGFQVPTCRGCWRPGDEFDLVGTGWKVRMVTWRTADLDTPIGVVHITLDDPEPMYGTVRAADGTVTEFEIDPVRKWPGWASSWRTTGAVTLTADRAGGVMALADAISTVRRHIERGAT